MRPVRQPHAEDADAVMLIAVQRVRRRDGGGHGGEDVHVDAVLVVQQSIHALRDDRRPAECPRAVEDIDRQHLHPGAVATVGDERRHLPVRDAGRRGLTVDRRAGGGTDPSPACRLDHQARKRFLPRAVVVAEQSVDAIDDHRRERGPGRTDARQAENRGLEILDRALCIAECGILQRSDRDVAARQDVEIVLKAARRQPLDAVAMPLEARRHPHGPHQPQSCLRTAVEHPRDRRRRLLEINVVGVGARSIHDPHEPLVRRMGPIRLVALIRRGTRRLRGRQRLGVESVRDHAHVVHPRTLHRLGEPRGRGDGGVAGEHRPAIEFGAAHERVDRPAAQPGEPLTRANGRLVEDQIVGLPPRGHPQPTCLRHEGKHALLRRHPVEDRVRMGLERRPAGCPIAPRPPGALDAEPPEGFLPLHHPVFEALGNARLGDDQHPRRQATRC